MTWIWWLSKSQKNPSLPVAWERFGAMGFFKKHLHVERFGATPKFWIKHILESMTWSLRKKSWTYDGNFGEHEILVNMLLFFLGWFTMNRCCASHNLGMIGFNLRQVDVGGIRFNENNVFIKNHCIHIYIYIYSIYMLHIHTNMVQHVLGSKKMHWFCRLETGRDEQFVQIKGYVWLLYEGIFTCIWVV